MIRKKRKAPDAVSIDAFLAGPRKPDYEPEPVSVLVPVPASEPEALSLALASPVFVSVTAGVSSPAATVAAGPEAAGLDAPSVCVQGGHIEEAGTTTVMSAWQPLVERICSI